MTTLMNLFTLSFWNTLAKAHLSELLIMLSAVIVVLMDPPIRRTVNKLVKPYGFLIRYLVFVLVCAFGYAALTLTVATILKHLLTIDRGSFIAPLTVVIFVIVGFIAGKQKQF